VKLSSQWLEYDEVGSTMEVAAELLAEEGTPPGIVFAYHQNAGRGRFDRTWISQKGDSLTMSLIFTEYASHSEPWLIGMAVAIAAAQTLGTQLRWPNDLAVKEKKLGGVLTQIYPDREGGTVPVVGIGINLNQERFRDDLSEFATSIRLAFGKQSAPKQVAEEIVHRIKQMREPLSWSDLAGAWAERDATPGKIYRLVSGEVGVAEGLGPQGQLICRVGQQIREVFAADALFGPMSRATSA